jgi:phage FluMu gp28-like protein
VHFCEWPEHLRKAEVRDFCERELKPLLETLDKRFVHCFGQDFGRVSDLSVLIPLAIQRDLRRVTPFVVELRNIPFEAQRDIVFYILDRLPRFGGACFDATGNGAYLGEVALQRYGSGLVEPIKMSLEWYREHMPPLKAAFEDDTLVIPRDADILGDLRLIKQIDGVGQVPKAERTKGQDGAKRHGDAAIALALAYRATRLDNAVYEYVSGAIAPVTDEDAARQDGADRTVRITAGFRTNAGIW